MDADTMSSQIHDELTALTLRYDTKLLAVAMMLRASAALRALHSAGVWQIKDVQDVLDVAMEDIFTPLPVDKVPPVAYSQTSSLQ